MCGSWFDFTPVTPVYARVPETVLTEEDFHEINKNCPTQHETSISTMVLTFVVIQRHMLKRILYSKLLEIAC